MNTNMIDSNALDKQPYAARWLLRVLNKISCGHLELISPQGQRWEFIGKQAGPRASLQLLDWGVCANLLRKGDIGMAEAYIADQLRTDDLSALLLLAAMNAEQIAPAIHGRWWAVLIYRLRHLLRRNSRHGSRKNIHAHYDLGNTFYQLWLDPSMTYSSAWFGGDYAQTLDRAQQGKYERIMQQLAPTPGDHILEIGCGWGGFAEYAARQGMRVTGITISQQQLNYAQDRIKHAGLDSLVTLQLVDYRDVDQPFDHVVSIEMFEAVGESYWPSYFELIKRSLKPGGRAVIQTITIAEEKFERYRSSTDFIQQYIFPGGMLPAVSVFKAIAADQGLLTASTNFFGDDYAETLQRWHEQFLHVIPQLNDFDLRFIRTWRFYLAYCEAGFRTRATNVMHAVLRHA